MDIVQELMNANIPIYGSITTTDESRTHDLLISAGLNWHMFSTIDIIKHSTGDTLHLSLEPMLQIAGEKMLFDEQMGIPGVQKPDYWQGESASYGIISNSNIGYIYIFDHINATNQIFLDAIKALYNTDGLIIDMRTAFGGTTDNNLNSGLDLLINKKITELKLAIRCNATDLISLCDFPESWFDFTPNPMTFYQKPIVILTGPKCESMGDINANRFKSIPNAKFFGRTTAGACGTSDGYYDYPAFGGDYLGWVFFTQIGDFYNPDNPYQYLSGREFPVDKKIWLTKDDAANGDDTVVKEALKWINNLSYCYNAQIDKTYTQNSIQFTADVRNPNDHSLSITPYILNNDSVIDSMNCSIAGNKVSGTWNVPGSSEAFYSVTVRTKDNVDNTIHTLPNIERFTTAGPLIIDSIWYYNIVSSGRYSFGFFLLNKGNTLPLNNVSLKITCNDPWVLYARSYTVAFPAIPPGAVVQANQYSAIYYDETFPGYFNLNFEISIDGWTYWKDSLKFIPTGIKDKELKPAEYILSQNYPNPFNPNTTIKYGIKERSNVKITIFNIIGEEAAIVLNEEMQPGYHQVDFNAANLPSGVYFYRIQAGRFVDTKKMVLLK